VPGPLADDVSQFVERVGTALAELAGRAPGDFHSECYREASSIAGAVIDSDGRRTDAELSAWLDDLGPHLDPPVIVTPQRLREGGMLDGTAAWLAVPSTMFDLLVQADRRDRRRRANLYYDAAMQLAHATAAIDLVPSPDEIAAIDRFRATLLRAMDAAGVPRPGQPDAGPPAAPGATPTATATSGAATAAPPAPELPPRRSIEELLGELDELVGLDRVKTDVRRLTSLLRVQRLRAERQLPTIETSHHLVFSGNPGTGKTTVARLLSQIYRSLEVLSRGHLVETDRSHLVAGYVGQTATKTREVLESGLGGTVLIDEAYALARGGEHDFGLEAIDTLVKFMEDHRDDLAIVAAGYPAEMEQLIDANPGLKSRFTRTIEFPDYTDDELVAIFERMAATQRYELSPDARARLLAVIAAEPRGRGFGNARFVRNVFEETIARHALRLAPIEHPTEADLVGLVADDIAAPPG
jgi:hypothetical protein